MKRLASHTIATVLMSALAVPSYAAGGAEVRQAGTYRGKFRTRPADSGRPAEPGLGRFEFYRLGNRVRITEQQGKRPALTAEGRIVKEEAGPKGETKLSVRFAGEAFSAAIAGLNNNATTRAVSHDVFTFRPDGTVRREGTLELTPNVLAGRTMKALGAGDATLKVVNEMEAEPTLDWPVRPADSAANRELRAALGPQMDAVGQKLRALNAAPKLPKHVAKSFQMLDDLKPSGQWYLAVELDPHTPDLLAQIAASQRSRLAISPNGAAAWVEWRGDHFHARPAGDSQLDARDARLDRQILSQLDKLLQENQPVKNGRGTLIRVSQADGL